MMPLKKYPRTQHLEGSRLQPGDQDLDSVPFANIANRYLVVEEKLDGANSAISFDESGQLYLQSRGHYLVGGPREKHFNLFKQWANCHQLTLWERLNSRYVLFGEWLYAKHTIFYDQFPHYFHEFDVYDRQEDDFLSTTRRAELLSDVPIISVPVLHAGPLTKLEELLQFIGPSLYKSATWKERLTQLCNEQQLNPERIWQETDHSEDMEGLYIKVEEAGKVVERYKWVRASFLTSVVDSGSHWLQRPIVPNQLHEDVNLFESES